MARAESVQSTARKIRRHQTARLSRKRTAARIELPGGDHDAVLRSELHREMMLAWTNLTDQYERAVMETYGVGKHPDAEIARPGNRLRQCRAHVICTLQRG
jgi:hypothetical protein